MSPKVRKRILTAILVSLLIHVGFLVWSYFVRLMPPIPFPEKPQAVFHVKLDKEEHVGQQQPKYDTEFSRKSPKPDAPYSETATMPSIESEQLVKNKIESSIQRNNMALIPSSVQPTQFLKKSDLNDLIMTKKVRRSVRENLVELGEVPAEEFASGSPVVISGESISKHFLDKSAVPANASLAAPLQSANTQNEFQVMQKAISGMEHEAKAMDLGTALTYQLFKYQEPSTGQKYFKLVVKVRDATINFPVIPKEVIFLVDASGSIGAQRLSQFIEGLTYSLKHLNPHDHFNILVFKDKTIPLSPTSLENNPANIKTALDFLEDLKSWSTTDLYQALKASINVKDPFVPSYRMLLSDGFPTRGIQDTREVINDISKLNDNRVSFFTFGGGAQLEPYMLDFVAFKNRGWSRVTDREYLIGREFAKLYDEIRDPLLLNVRYYVSGLNEKEIFPQTMPDFFKGSSFVVYGKYTREDKFVIQIKGEMVHVKKEFLVNGSLKNALRGDKQIAHDWAFHKVYYLISQLKYNANNQALINAINDLCNRFHIITPYSISESGDTAVVHATKPKMKVAPPVQPQLQKLKK